MSFISVLEPSPTDATLETEKKKAGSLPLLPKGIEIKKHSDDLNKDFLFNIEINCA